MFNNDDYDTHSRSSSNNQNILDYDEMRYELQETKRRCADLASELGRAQGWLYIYKYIYISFQEYIYIFSSKYIFTIYKLRIYNICTYILVYL